MKKLLSLQIILIVLAVLAIILSTFYFIPRSALPALSRLLRRQQAGPSGTENLTPIAEDQYTQTYSDETYRFSFKYPEGFTVTVVPLAGKEGGETILVESPARPSSAGGPDKKVGIQMLISPGSNVDITETMIQSDIPNMKVSDSQTVEIGPNRRGLAFMSDNPAFGGASREVWFMFNGNLYQISTYAEFDELLKGLFGTWIFGG